TLPTRALCRAPATPTSPSKISRRPSAPYCSRFSKPNLELEDAVARSRKARMMVVTAIVVGTLAPAALAAEGRASGGQERRQQPRGHVTPSDIQDQFDAYAIVQAQDTLDLSDEQFPQFVR